MVFVSVKLLADVRNKPKFLLIQQYQIQSIPWASIGLRIGIDSVKTEPPKAIGSHDFY